ncbi:MAG: hypothetical protein ACI35O_02845 [Bacillaceae bacterium]
MAIFNIIPNKNSLHGSFSKEYALKDMHLTMPRAETQSEWITLGFHEDLDEAAMIALEGMLDLMKEIYGYKRKEALAIVSLVVDLQITQIVNGVKGVHAV